MNYTEAREFIDSLKKRGITPGLTAIAALCEKLKNPQNDLEAVHIAGTNGKGSTGAFLESILKAHNKTVCRFVSPAVGDYLEAFTYNGSPVSEGLYTECADMVKDALYALEEENIFPSAFEAETAIAFLIFKKLCPDYAIIECGMGGRLDSTNIIPSPAAAVITSISLDHTAFLGNSLEEIAAEKCGIIKNNGKVITSASLADEAKRVIEKKCTEKNAELFYTALPVNESYLTDKTSFEFDGEKYEISLLGSYQPQNAVLAIKTAQVLNIPNSVIINGIKNAKWEYRFERIGKYILDGAHNADAAKKLASSVEILQKNKRTAFICGCFRDKDYKAIANATAPYADIVYCITPPSPRGLDNSVLCDTFCRAGAEAYTADSIDAALKQAENYDLVVIFGSLSYLSEAKRLIEGTYNNAKMQ